MQHVNQKLAIPSSVRILPDNHAALLWLDKQTEIGDISDLLSVEEMAIAQTYKSLARRQEYERTRWLIRTALSYRKELPRHPSGMPLWPDGWIGSISHKQGHCGVMLSSPQTVASVGLDIESPEKMHDGLADKIFSDQELVLLASLSKSQNIPHQKILTIGFSFKEALFKAHFALGQRMFYFHDAAIVDIDSKCQSIAAMVHLATSDVTAKGSVTKGNFQWVESDTTYVVTTAVVELAEPGMTT